MSKNIPEYFVFPMYVYSPMTQMLSNNVMFILQVPVSKLMMLVAAKWRSFCETNPHMSGGNQMGSEENTNTSTTSDYTPKARPGRPPKEPKVNLLGPANQRECYLFSYSLKPLMCSLHGPTKSFNE